MNKNIELVFKEEVYTNWKVFKKVIDALTNNKILSTADYKEPRDNLNMKIKRE